ncbi:MAG: hypothetical protein K8R02_07850 [Anaerohalosphaeraceae bacterium]|nr:hypothetical protein [Anaerohalosphaeraceae bacterium]
MNVVIYIATFVFLFVPITGILKEHFTLGNKTRVVLSVCASAFGLIAINEMYMADGISRLASMFAICLLLSILVPTVVIGARFCRILIEYEEELKIWRKNEKENRQATLENHEQQKPTI